MDCEYMEDQFELTYGHSLYTYTLSDDSFFDQSVQINYGMKYLLCINIQKNKYYTSKSLTSFDCSNSPITFITS